MAANRLGQIHGRTETLCSSMGGNDTQDSTVQNKLKSPDLQGANLVAAAKPLLTPGSARWSDRFSMGPCAHEFKSTFKSRLHIHSQ
jgi:hypothetical protein